MASLRVYLCVGVLVCTFMFARAERFGKAPVDGKPFKKQRLSKHATVADRVKVLEQSRDAGLISDENYKTLLSHLKNKESRQLKH